MQHKNDDIELCSEKAQRIIGDIPRGLVRWGIALIAAISIALILAVSLLPYPYSNGESILEHLMGI